MMKKLIGLLLSIVHISVVYAQDTLYVSPAGSGDLFSREAPGNVDAVGHKLAGIEEPRRNITVLFLGGLYELEQPLQISSKEKNKNIDTLVLAGSTTAKAILSGGRRVTGWKNTGKGIYKASLPETTDFRQLYVEGKMAVRARTPNRGNNDDYSPYYRVTGFDEENRTVLVQTSETSAWEDINTVEMVINHHWYQSRFRIEQMTPNGETTIIRPIMPAQKHLFQLTYAKMLAAGKPYYFENSQSFLDAESEWFLDKAEFARNIDISHCHLAGAGDNGIIFTKGVKNSKIASTHFDQISANGIVIDTYRKGLLPEELLCEKILIEDNLIENVGMHYTSGMGLIVSFVAKTTIQYNEIRNCRYTGMQIGNHFGDKLSVMRDNVIRRNNIHHVMQLHDDGGAIYTLSLQPGTRIKENWMHHFGRSEWADNFPVNGVFLDNSSGYIRVQDNVFTDLTTVDRIKEQCAGNATTRDNILDNNNTQDKEIKENAGYRSTVGVILTNQQ